MAVFVAVAEESGFAAAARRLTLSAPKVTRAVASLELRVGTPLLLRTTRSVRLTESGQRYLDDCRRILAELAEAEEAAAGAHATPRGLLSITAPALFGQMFVTPLATRYLDQYPQVRLRALFVDRVVGMADEGIDVAIRIGELPDSALIALSAGQVRRVVCAAPALPLDYRIGGFCIAEVARILKENKKQLPFSLYIVNAVQEEIGLRGAEMIANTIKPHVAIVTDVTHDTSTPLVNSKIQGDTKCGLGPSLTFAPAVHNKLLQQVIDVADAKKIDYQLAAASRSTGTDTDAFAYSNGGVPSVLISLPLRYMHTTVEMAHEKDILSVIDLIYETLLDIKAGQSYKYF